MSEIKKFFTKLKWEKLVTAIVAIVLGIVFVADPNGSGDAVCKDKIFYFGAAVPRKSDFFGGFIAARYFLYRKIRRCDDGAGVVLRDFPCNRRRK